MSDGEPTAKVLFRVPEDDGSANVETLWAYALGNDQYRLDNLPFFAYSVSLHDVVFAPHDADEGMPTFVRTVEKSGNRTLRILLTEAAAEGNASQEILERLRSIGCSYEGANRKYVSVNIPPEVVIDAVTEYLEKVEIQWEYADPTYDEIYPDDV